VREREGERRLGRRGGLRTGWASTLNFFFFFTLVAGPKRSLRLKLSDTKVYEPQMNPEPHTLTPNPHAVGLGVVACRVPDGIDDWAISCANSFNLKLRK